MTTRQSLIESFATASAAFALPSLAHFDRAMVSPQSSGSIFDVTQFGAKGDGAADDQAANQAAVDGARGAGGGIVYSSGVFIAWLESRCWRTFQTSHSWGRNL